MPVPALMLADTDRATLRSWTRSTRVSAGRVQRARIVLTLADGATVAATARALGVSRPTVIKWRDRFARNGIDGLTDQARSGRPRTVEQSAIIAATLTSPADPGGPGWSSRTLAARLGIADATVARTWRRFGLQPWKPGPLAFATSPELPATARAVVGLYVDSADRVIVLGEDDDPGAQPADDPDYGSGDRNELTGFLDAVARTHPRRLRLVAAAGPDTDRGGLELWASANRGAVVHVTADPDLWWPLVQVLVALDPGGLGEGAAGAGEPVRWIVPAERPAHRNCQ